MSTGKLVKDYRPLMEYLSLSAPEHRNRVLPSNKDFDVIKSWVLEKPKKVSELIRELTNVKKVLIDGELAVRAVEKAWGLRMSEDLAIKEISEELAGWVLEVSEELGLIKLSSK